MLLPCELIEQNGPALKAAVLHFARLWQLDAGFADWLDNACVFCSTLVDRIVTGYPQDAAAIEARAFQRGVAREQEKSAQAAMAAKGLIVNDVTEAEHARMREKVQPVWKMFIPSVGEGLYKEVTDQLAAK